MKKHVFHTGRAKGIIVLLGICVTSAIRNLKEGPMIGSDSRQYKIKSLLNEDPTVDFTDVPSSRAAPVQVLCTEQSMILLISADLHSNGRRVTSEELSLGWSTESCKAFQYSDTEYVIKADLHQCGSELLIEGDHLVYSNQLIYTPMQNSFGIVRTSSISIPIECHYKRIHFVSSTDVKPSWEPFTSTKSAVELIPFFFPDLLIFFYLFIFYFFLDDWRTKRSSYVYHLGEVMNIQASFLMAGHSPLRLVMENCVVTLEPNAASVPRYMFIQNHGCLIDSKVPDSSARFMPRKQNHVLQMQMDAFRFHEDQRNTVSPFIN
uniref:Zona pellucida sperm-binding protein 3 n=1 Tax=Sinocyclocheilus anshuiensis TaxID=1608454 RepID=A0A671KG95_9TELE